MPALLLSASPDCWTLKGEGKAGAVFTYTGKEKCLVGLVLRAKKLESRLQERFPELELEIWQAVPGLVSREGFINREAYPDLVLRPHLGKYMGTYQMVELPLELQAGLLQQLRLKGRQPAPEVLSDTAILMPDYTFVGGQVPQSSHRPPGEMSNTAGCHFRLQISAEDVCSSCRAAFGGDSQGSTSDDLTQGGRTMCIEIKPKCGFLPESAAISPESNVKKTKSRFSLHQLLKYAKGDVRGISQYDPLDLFSGNPQRIQHAITCLLEEPQNNLRVFIGGNSIPIEHMDTHLLRVLPGVESFDSVQVFKKLAVGALERSGVLERILELQKLDKHDIEGIYTVYQSLQGANSAQNFCQNETEASAYQQSVEILCSMSRERKLAIIRDYLIASTAKDCSIMIACQFMEMPSESNLQLFCSVHVADLDYKALSKLKKHYVLDQEIVAAARSS